MSDFSCLSKQVGWDKKTVSYPQNKEEIAKANDFQILSWHRFCSSPENEEQINFINLIFERFKQISK